MSQPRIYLCGFPKAGLHMLEQAVSAISIPAADNNWVGTQAWGDKPIPEHVDVLGYKLSLIYPGTHAKGHLNYDEAFAKLIWDLGISMVFIYRDLRDVVVSQAHHVLKAGPDTAQVLRHPNPEPYRALGSFEEVLIACIEGLGIFPGIFPRWSAFAGWLNCPSTHSIKFEDLRHHGHQTCAGVARFAYRLNGVAVDKTTARKMATAMQKRTLRRKQAKTFRKGKTGGWRDEFTPRVVDCFKAHDPGWLTSLGYEQDEDW